MVEYTRNANGDFECETCGRIFSKSRQSSAFYHLKKHMDDMKYECPICQKKFLFEKSCTMHRVSQHPDESADVAVASFKCPYEDCTYSGTTWANRRIHFLRRHCATECEKLRKEGNECAVCRKVFRSATAFMYHAAKCIDGSQIPYFNGII